MGRIRTKYIKRISKEMLENHKEKFSADFKNNKKALDDLADIQSKQLRNKIAGCIVHLVNTSKDTSEVR